MTLHPLLTRALPVLRWPVGLALVALAWVGAVMLTQDPTEAAFAALLGSTGGLTVGLATTWSQERSVRPADLIRFPCYGVVVLVALHGGSALGRWGSLVAIALLVAWWGLTTLVPAPPPQPSPSHSPTTPSVEDVEVRALEQAEIVDLCRIWENLRRGDRSTGDTRLAEVRGRVLDEVEKRNPTGFARWMSAEAPENLERYVASR